MNYNKLAIVSLFSLLFLLPLSEASAQTSGSTGSVCTSNAISAACQSRFSVEQRTCISSRFYETNGYCNYSDQALAMNCGMTGAGKGIGFCIPSYEPPGCFQAYSYCQICSTFGLTGGLCITGTGGTPVGGPSNPATGSYLATIFDIINRALNNILAFRNASTQNENTSTQGTSGANRTVSVNASKLNVRSAPVTSAAIVRQLSAGETFTASGSVVGENVEGSAKWWKTSDNNYVWAGGTVEQP
jgi:hypothetical protein